MSGRVMKSVTFSYDDGVTQDRRLVSLFNRYGLKCTFNLNSGLLGRPGELRVGGVKVSHNKVDPGEVRSLYAGHEIAAHTLTHPFLPEMEAADIVRQVEDDRLALSELAGYEVVGMAYPGGGVNFSERVAEIIKNGTRVKYARTTKETYSFGYPENPHTLHPTVKHTDFDGLFRLAEEFLALPDDAPALFYIWGHSYELDPGDGWERFEEFLRFISRRDGIFYGTNTDCLGQRI